MFGRTGQQMRARERLMQGKTYLRRLIIIDVSQLEVSRKERMLHSHAFELYSGKVRLYITPKY